MDPNDIMGDKERLQLQKMLKEGDVLDQTELIRKLKHSVIMRKEIDTLIELKKTHGHDMEALNLECMINCSFLFNYYTDLYNKIRKDEIDMTILFQFIEVLEKIEDGKVDQHEGSFMVGSLLKKIYIDSALKKGDKLDQEHTDSESRPPQKEAITVSWKEFKHLKK